MNKAKKTFIFIPSELTEYHIWRNVLKSNSTVYLLGYTLPCNVHNSANENNNNNNNDNEVVLILGFYNSPPTENNQICPYCYTRIYSEDCLHICARSLKKYKFESSYIKKYNPLSDDYNNNNASNIWISVDMNTLPSSLKHGIMMKYARGFNYPENESSSEGVSFNRWMCSIMQNEIGQPLNHLIRWLNESSGSTDGGDGDWDWSSSIQRQHKVVNSQPESRHFIPTTMIQCCTKIINKCVNFSYTLSLIKYHFDTAKPRPPPPPLQSSSITSSMKKCSTSLLKNNNDNNIQKKEKDNVRVNSSTRSIHPSAVSYLIPDASLSMIGAIQLLILILCLITVPYKSTNNHNHSSHYYSYDDNGDMGNGRKCCIQESLPPPPPPTRQSPSPPPPPRRCCRDYTTSGLSISPSFPHTTTNKDDSTSSPMNWLPNDLNCKIIPTLGLFYLDNEEDNYTSKLSSPLSSSSSLTVSSSSWLSTVVSTYLPTLILYNSTNDITKYISSSSAKFENRCCWMNILYRCVEYFTCELTRLLLWLESGKPAGLKMNLHLAHLMGQFFLYHILAWRSYVTFIIYILFIHVLSILQQFTEVDTFNVYFLANLTTIICLIFSTVYLLATTPTTRTSFSDGDGQSVIRFPLIIKVFVTYFSIILRLMLALLTCLLLDIIELITLHLTSFYIYATHLLRLQLRTISASWRLCRNSSKWNPLRHRVDKIPDMYIDPNEVLLSISSLQKKISLSSSLASSSSYSAPPSSPSSSSSCREDYGQGTIGEVEKRSYVGDGEVVQGTKKLSEQPVVVQNKTTGGEEDTLYKFVTNKQNSDMLFDQLTRQKCGVYLDRLLVSTLLGLGIGLCLFSTTIAFYITFTCIQLCLLLVKNILKCTVWFIMDFPLESIVLWTCNSPYYKTKLIIEAPKMNSKHFKCLRLKLTRIDFHEMYAESHLVRKALFSKGLSFRELLHRVICAEDIR